MANDGGGGDEAGPLSGPSSPKNRVKFLCSHGGKILPRPSDGHLKYVGGETRVIAVRRDINFSDLMKKLSAEFEGDMILKYQVMLEDLDVLVSVKTDEDLKHMLDEYDRHVSEGTTKLRAFLFPLNLVLMENQTASPMDLYAAEQRYVDAINSTVRVTPTFRLPLIHANRPTFSISACSSPKCSSPESNNLESMSYEPTFANGGQTSRSPMVKVHSSPSLCSLANPHNHNNNQSSHYLYQQQQHYYSPHQQHHPHGYQPYKPPPDPHRLATTLSMGRSEFGRATTGYGPNQYYSGRHNMWSFKYGFHEDHSGHGFKTVDRSDSLPHSPRNRIQE